MPVSVDTSIYANAVRGFNTPFENLKAQLGQQAEQGLAKERQLRADALKRQADEDGQIRQIWQDFGSNVPDALARTYRVSPETAAKIEQQYSAARQNWAQEHGVAIKNERAETERSVSLLNAVRGDQQLFESLKPVLMQRDPDIVPILGQIQDANDPRLGQLLEYADTAKNIFDRREKANEHLMAGDFFRGAAGTLATATDDAERQEMLKGFAPHLPAEQVQALAGMTPAQLERASMTAKDAEQLAQTAAHNQATVQSTLRGQDLSAETQRRGQDISAATARRGQNLTDARDREKIAKGLAGEKTRNVTSGDANKLALIGDSLNELQNLSGEFASTKGATGTAAKLGTMLPNFVSEATGIGSEAKSRQAVIDRVKQVIGKGMEGGVLRKEDEAKYERILPTIYDPPPVAAAKINGLNRAIHQRQDELLSSLEDAGYDTSRFRARQDAPIEKPKAKFTILQVK